MRGFDRFVGQTDQMIVDTTDFSKVDTDHLISQIKQWISLCLRTIQGQEDTI